MADERDRAVRLAEHADHLRWTAQHAAWVQEAERWLRALRDRGRTLDAVRDLLEREQSRIEDHLAHIRQLDAAIAQHEVVLTTLDQSACSGCEPEGAPSHEQSLQTHEAETQTHRRLSGRIWRIRQAFGKLDELLETEQFDLRARAKP